MSNETIFCMEPRDEYLLLYPRGSIGSLLDAQLQEELDALLEQLEQTDTRHIVVDLRRVPYFGSSMLKALLQIWRKVQDRDGRIVLCNVSEVGREVLKVGKFDHIWKWHPSREQAIEALATED